jgi:hypothetical protein
MDEQVFQDATLEGARLLDEKYPSSTRELFYVPLAKNISGGLIEGESSFQSH